MTCKRKTKTKDNYVQVTPSGGTLEAAGATNGDIVVVNLDTNFAIENDTVRFALENVVAQPSNLGVVGFKIYSAGQVGDDLEASCRRGTPGWRIFQ